MLGSGSLLDIPIIFRFHGQCFTAILIRSARHIYRILRILALLSLFSESEILTSCHIAKCQQRTLITDLLSTTWLEVISTPRIRPNTLDKPRHQCKETCYHLCLRCCQKAATSLIGSSILPTKALHILHMIAK